jgi:hypothetical protein
MQAGELGVLVVGESGRVHGLIGVGELRHAG